MRMSSNPKKARLPSMSDHMVTDRNADDAVEHVDHNPVASQDNFPLRITPEAIGEDTGGASATPGKSIPIDAHAGHGQYSTVGQEDIPLNASSENLVASLENIQMRCSDSRALTHRPRRHQQFMRVVSPSWRPPSSRAASELPVVRKRAGSAATTHTARDRAQSTMRS